MIEHIYSIRKSSWWIHIKIVAYVINFDKFNSVANPIKAADGIWFKYADKPLSDNAMFSNDNLPYLKKGIQLVQNKIRTNSLYDETLIVIKGLEFNPCDFQEEGLTVAIIEWASKAFHFDNPKIGVDFNKEKNRYIFDFNDVKY